MSPPLVLKLSLGMGIARRGVAIMGNYSIAEASEILLATYPGLLPLVADRFFLSCICWHTHPTTSPLLLRIGPLREWRREYGDPHDCTVYYSRLVRSPVFFADRPLPEKNPGLSSRALRYRQFKGGLQWDMNRNR